MHTETWTSLCCSSHKVKKVKVNHMQLEAVMLHIKLQLHIRQCAALKVHVAKSNTI